MNKKILLPVLMIMTLVVLQEASAVPQYLLEFESQYPAAINSRIDGCVLCHTVIPARNPYGLDFGARFIQFNNASLAFANIEILDSDGDNFTNIAEINALTFPGNQSDSPQPAADTIPPAVTITFPVNGSVAGTFSITVNGTATDNIGVTGVTVNDNALTIIPSISVNYSTTITLIIGTNTITVTASDAAGNTANATSIVTTFTVGRLLAIAANRTNITAGLATNVMFTITDANTGAAISGALVTLGGPAAGSGTTGAAGTVNLPVIGLSNATITATASMAGAMPAAMVLVAKGDVNGDGIVNIVDALFIAQHTVGLRTIDTTIGNVKGDDPLNVIDALFIAQFTVGLRDDPTTG